MAKKIFSVGFNFPGGFAENISLRSDRSLLDADIVVFKPTLRDFRSLDEFNGQKLLTEAESFKYTDVVKHWLQQLVEAWNAEKTIFIFLPEYEEAFYDTGRPDNSGNSRGRRTTNIIVQTNNYAFLPFQIGKAVKATGKEMKVCNGQSIIAGYWREFAPMSVYRVYLEDAKLTPLFVTKSGAKVVGAVHPSEGNPILLPSLQYDEEDFYTGNEEESEPIWTKEGLDFGRRLSSCFIEIDKALRSGRASTPLPEWAQQAIYRLPEEDVIEARIETTSEQIEELVSEREMLSNNLEQAGSLRRLLFETGHPLEEAIIEALHLLGFKAENYKEGTSEFDAVFTSDEGRFLGEAEGKDNSAVNVDKLRQLVTNLEEDYERDDVNEHAKGILFSNASRLTSPDERREYFTAKCFGSAKRYKAALVQTPDLFTVARYLKEQKDEDFAKRCREALRDTEGDIVQFPPVPGVATTIDVVEADGVISAEAASS